MNKLVKEFQCSGCANGGEDCFEQSTISIACIKHHSGTITFPGGKLFLGMPKGFNKVGEWSGLKMEVFASFNQFKEKFGYDVFNIPVWKTCKDNITFVRGLSPRISRPFLHVIGGDCTSEIDCINISDQEMD